MKKNDLMSQFAERLREAMIAAGYGSSRSSSGVDIHKLVEITGYSSQICRKYLRGEVIPEPAKLNDIALKLSVSPGWLLFGDSHSTNRDVKNKITISKDLLHYIFIQANALYNVNPAHHEIPDYLFGLTQNISQIDTDETQSRKVIDIALSSAKHFKKPN